MGGRLKIAVRVNEDDCNNKLSLKRERERDPTYFHSQVLKRLLNSFLATSFTLKMTY